MKTKKTYFQNEDETIAYNEEHFQQLMKEEGLNEIEVIEAIPVPESEEDFVFCRDTDECYEKSNCGKHCESYEAKSKSNKKCVHKGTYCDFGGKVTLILKNTTRELPILFSTPMVQAIDADRKQMTRRTSGLEKVNADPNSWTFMDHNAKTFGIFKFYPKEGTINHLTECKPRYQVGDKMWVKETYFYAPGDLGITYKADYTEEEIKTKPSSIKWKSSILCLRIMHEYGWKLPECVVND